LVVENATCGQQLALLEIKQGYAKVKTWYSTGYVSVEFVRLAAPAAASALPYDRTTIQCEGDARVPVYSDLRATSVIANLTCNQPVSFIEMERGYVRIQIADRTGYVAANFVRLERRDMAVSATPAVPAVLPPPATPPAVVPAAPRVEDKPQVYAAPAAPPVIASPAATREEPVGRQETEAPFRAYPRVEVFGGYNYVHLDHGTGWMDGWNAAVTGNFHSLFGVKGELSGLYGKDRLYSSVRYSSYSFMGGPQLTTRSRSVDGFFHALFGVSHLGDSVPFFGIRVGESVNAFSMAFGGGVDWHRDTWGVRIMQVDYLPWRALGGTAHNFRLSSGFIFRFH
jgi:hypothetical protein